MSSIVNHNISLVYDSIIDLINADDGVVKPGMVVQTLGYYNKGDCSSGIFYVDTELNQDEVVDNGIIFESSYTINGNRLYFKRIFDKTLPVSVSLYGAVGDGVTDDSTAIQRCVDNNDNIIFELNKSYKINKSIKIINRCGVKIDCNNATFIRKTFEEFDKYDNNTSVCNHHVFVVDASEIEYGTYVTMPNRNKISIKNFKCNMGYAGYRYKNQTSKSVIYINKPVCEVEFDGITINSEVNTSPIYIHEYRSSFNVDDKITLKNINISSSNIFDSTEYKNRIRAIYLNRDNVYLENINIHNFHIGIDIGNFDINNIEINGLYMKNDKIKYLSQYIINDQYETIECIGLDESTSLTEGCTTTTITVKQVDNNQQQDNTYTVNNHTLLVIKNDSETDSSITARWYFDGSTWHQLENDIITTNNIIPVPDLENPSLLNIKDLNNHNIRYRGCCIRYMNEKKQSNQLPSAIKKLVINNVTCINCWTFLLLNYELHGNSYLEFNNVLHKFDDIYLNSKLDNSYFIYSVYTIDESDVYKMKISNSKLLGLPSKLNLFSNSSCNFDHICYNTTFENYFSAPVDSNMRDKLYRESYDKNWVTKPYSEIAPSASCIGEVILKPYNKFRNLVKSGYGAWYLTKYQIYNKQEEMFEQFYPNVDKDDEVTDKFTISYGTNSNYSSSSVYNNMSKDCFNRLPSILISENDVSKYNKLFESLKLPSKVDHTNLSDDKTTSSATMNIINIKNILTMEYRPFAYSKRFSGKLCKYDSTYGRDKLISNDIRDLPNPGDMYAFKVDFNNVPSELKITATLSVKYKIYIPVLYDFNEPKFRSIDPNDEHIYNEFSFLSVKDNQPTIFGKYKYDKNNGVLNIGGKQVNFNKSDDLHYFTLDETFNICSDSLTIKPSEDHPNAFHDHISLACYGSIPSDAFDLMIQNKITDLYNSMLGSFDDTTKELIMKSVKYTVDDFVLTIDFDSSNINDTQYPINELNKNPLSIYNVFISKCDPSDSIQFFKEDRHNIYNLIYNNDYYSDLYQNDYYSDSTKPETNETTYFNYSRLFYDNYRKYAHIVNVDPDAHVVKNTDTNTDEYKIYNNIYKNKSFRILSIPWISNIVPYHKTNSNDVYSYMNREFRQYSYAGNTPSDKDKQLLDIIPQPNGFSVKRMSNNNCILSDDHKYPEIRKKLDSDKDEDYGKKYYSGDTCVSLIKINKYYFKKRTTFYFNALITANVDIADEYTGKIIVRIDNYEVASYSRNDHSIKSIDIKPGEHSLDIFVMFINGNNSIPYENVEMDVKNFYITENPEERYFYRDIKYNEYYKIPIYKNGIISISPSKKINTNLLQIDKYSPLSVRTGRGQLHVSYPCTDEEYDKYLNRDVVMPISAITFKDVNFGGDEDINGITNKKDNNGNETDNLTINLPSNDQKVSIYPYIYPTNCSETNIRYILTNFDGETNPCCKITNGFIQRLGNGTAKLKISIGNSVYTPSIIIDCNTPSSQ